MYLKRRIAAQRLRRVLTRTQCASAQPPIPVVGLALSSQRQSHETPAPRGTWTEGPLGRRSNQRLGLSAHVSLRRSGGFGFQVGLGDLSVGGCKVELVEAVDPGERVIARLPGLEPFPAKVTWVDAPWAGLNFERPMHPAVLESLQSRLD
jgi:hypothetical protein